ncbi:MAG TPA: hypothetical protein VMS56_14095 [Thermoanaerobaculia bacterium]|nr:hypothetical protein [Thermoanaerobaculia bacterium]
MDAVLRAQLESFLKPLYQDLDGLSHFGDVERIGAIARRLHQPPAESERLELELLILFHRLGGWLSHMGNPSRVVFASEGRLSEDLVMRVAVSLGRLDDPGTEAERAVASALAIDSAGASGLVHGFFQARREGRTPIEHAREVMESEPGVPPWMGPDAAAWLLARRRRARELAARILEEHELRDLA